VTDLLVIKRLPIEVTPDMFKVHFRSSMLELISNFASIRIIAKDLENLISRRSTDGTYTASVGYELELESSGYENAVSVLNSMVEVPEGSTASPIHTALLAIAPEAYSDVDVSRDPTFSRVQTTLSSGNAGGEDDSSGSSSAGLIAGILVAVIIVLVAVAVAVAYVRKHGRFLGFRLSEDGRQSQDAEFMNPMFSTKARDVGFDNTTYEALDEEEDA
jgi:hypothetical protein